MAEPVTEPTVQIAGIPTEPANKNLDELDSNGNPIKDPVNYWKHKHAAAENIAGKLKERVEILDTANQQLESVKKSLGLSGAADPQQEIESRNQKITQLEQQMDDAVLSVALAQRSDINHGAIDDIVSHLRGVAVIDRNAKTVAGLDVAITDLKTKRPYLFGDGKPPVDVSLGARMSTPPGAPTDGIMPETVEKARQMGIIEPTPEQLAKIQRGVIAEKKYRGVT